MASRPSLPNLNPDKSVSGITIDPFTGERIIPESTRADGSVRQQRKVRPGYRPQEDVSLFRGSRQTAAASQGRTVPGAPAKKVVPGAAPGSAAAAADKPVSKSAAKNAKRKAKKQAEKEQAVKDNWDSESEEGNKSERKANAKKKDSSSAGGNEKSTEEEKGGSEEVKDDAGQDSLNPPGDLASEVAKLDLGS